jgi:V/A-type H+/Na+-transporting ATPase subunit K
VFIIRGKTKFYILMVIFQFVLVLMVLSSVNFITTVVGQTGATNDSSSANQGAALAISAALAVGLSVIGASLAIKTTGTAAISALSENEGAFFKAFLVVALGEALAIYGLIVAILLWTKIP